MEWNWKEMLKERPSHRDQLGNTEEPLLVIFKAVGSSKAVIGSGSVAYQVRTLVIEMGFFRNQTLPKTQLLTLPFKWITSKYNLSTFIIFQWW